MKEQSYAPGADQSTVFAAKEAYRTIRTNLMFSLAKKGCRTILFTSSVQGEGKTTTAANVAFSLARSNKKVLLIDLDLRRPRVHRLVKKPNSPGLTNILSGFSSVEDVCYRNVFPNLDVICAGTISPNPSELVASEGMAELLKKLQPDYDFIILDTPPVNVVSDALTLVEYIDGIILIVRPNFTARKEVQKAIEQIHFVGGKILGVVANAVVTEKKRSYRRYGSYGSYGSYATAAVSSEQAQAQTDTQSSPVPAIDEEAASNPTE